MYYQAMLRWVFKVGSGDQTQVSLLAAASFFTRPLSGYYGLVHIFFFLYCKFLGSRALILQCLVPRRVLYTQHTSQSVEGMNNEDTVYALVQLDCQNIGQ